MSFDTVDDLQLTEERLAHVTGVLDAIHLALLLRAEWSPDQLDQIAAVLRAEGYTFPLDELDDTDRERAVARDDLSRYRPPVSCSRLTCREGEECAQPPVCGCPCHNRQDTP